MPQEEEKILNILTSHDEILSCSFPDINIELNKGRVHRNMPPAPTKTTQVWNSTQTRQRKLPKILAKLLLTSLISLQTTLRAGFRLKIFRDSPFLMFMVRVVSRRRRRPRSNQIDEQS